MSVRQRVVNAWRRLWSLSSRAEWAVRLLRLPRWEGPAREPGLLLIQIDGLSRAEFDIAVANRRLRFLRSLLRRKRYRVETLYSGLPSSTPAFQGELFYGVECAVPSFCFRDRDSGHAVRMFDPAPAAKVQARLSTQGEGLLAHGSAYSDIYSGGAAEPHFCPSEFGWGSVWRAVRPIRFSMFMLLYLDSAIRVIFMMAVELVLAVIDAARGVFDRQYLWKELSMVPARVAVGVLLRELITIGASIDAARGLPVIHLNYLGYDEQAHRRGPASKFAHWSLKGIDRAIRRLSRAARRSRRRDYQVWIYSDHGQIRTVSYTEERGKSIEQAVADIFQAPVHPVPVPASPPERGAQYHRSRWTGLPQRVAPAEHTGAQAHPADAVLVAAMGSLGHIYCPPFETPEQRDDIARRLIAEAGVPMVLAADGESRALVWTAAGCFSLPGDAAEVLGSDHPFLQQVAADLVSICRHPDSGELIFCGWDRHGRSISFSHECGAHAGPSIEETSAIAVLPRHVQLPGNDHGLLRPKDLRAIAMNLLGRPVDG